MTLKKIGFLGPAGTNTEMAALKYSQEQKAELEPFATIFDVVMAVDSGKVSEGVVPIENSIEGSVTETLDLLADQDIKVKIKSEIDLAIFHSLIIKNNLALGEIKEVISHAQALAQCQHYLRKNLPGVSTHTAPSTAAAAMWVAEDKFQKAAAIASTQIAKKLGLMVLAEKINDYESITRFVVIGERDHEPTGNDKTTIVFSLPKDKPGGLHDLLGEFAEREINLTKIESRPRKKDLGDYLFFVDLQGHRKDQNVAGAVKALGQKASFFKMLGSYPERAL